MKKISILILLILFLFGTLLSQTQEEKEKVKKEKVITNQTLRELKGKISIMGREEERSAEEIKEEEKGESLEESSKTEVKDEKYWRGLKKEIEEKISQASKRVETLQNELDNLYRDFYSIDDPARRDLIQVKIVETTRKLEKAQEELEMAKKELEEFMERARKEGALPGWIR